MSLFEKVVTKKNITIISGLVAVIVLMMGTLEPFRLCGENWRGCMDINYVSGLFLLPSIPLFLLSLITYFLCDEVFHTWIKFALVWIPLTILLTLAAPEYSQSLLPIVKSSVSFWFSALFFLISLVIVIWKWVSLPPVKK